MCDHPDETPHETTERVGADPVEPADAVTSDRDDPTDDDDDGHLITTLTVTGGIAEIRLTGEIDVASAHDVREALSEALDRGATTVVFELSEVSFMDSSALAVLVDGSNRAAEAIVRNPSPSIRRILELTGLVRTLQVEP